MLQALIVANDKQPPSALRDHKSLRASRAQARIEAEVLALYIAGWSEADPDKIADATAAEFVLDDAFVGKFSSHTLPKYFEILRSRFGVTTPTAQKDLAFALRGPMDGPSGEPIRQYWREAPHLGLTGVTWIAVTPRGIVADSVAYDLNMACEILRSGQTSFQMQCENRPIDNYKIAPTN
jgi:hypothetical protein